MSAPPVAASPRAAAQPEASAWTYSAPEQNWAATVALMTGLAAVTVAAISYLRLVPATAYTPALWWAPFVLIVPGILAVIALRKSSWTGTGKALGVIALAAALLAGGTGGWMAWQRTQGVEAFQADFATKPANVTGLSINEAESMGWDLCQMSREGAGRKTLLTYIVSNLADGVSPYTVGWVGGTASNDLCPDQNAAMTSMMHAVSRY